MSIKSEIESLRRLARGVLESEDIETAADSDEAPTISLTCSVDGTDVPWQAMVVYDGGMGTVPLASGNPCETPDEAIESLREELEGMA